MKLLTDADYVADDDGGGVDDDKYEDEGYHDGVDHDSVNEFGGLNDDDDDDDDVIDEDVNFCSKFRNMPCGRLDFRVLTIVELTRCDIQQITNMFCVLI